MQFAFPSSINWTVSELTQYLRGIFSSAEELQNLWVTGEVSNATRSSSGHFYFTLKDNTSSIRCVMWKQQFVSQHYLPKDGELLQVHGYIDIYPPMVFINFMRIVFHPWELAFFFRNLFA